MRLTVKLLVLCGLLTLTASAQRITKFMAGPAKNQTKVVVAIIEPEQETYKMESLILDFDPVKSQNELPATMFIDLTSTIRNTTTGEKDQKILQISWKNTGEIQFNCGGKWEKIESTPSFEKILEAVKGVIKITPLNMKNPVEMMMPKDVQQKVDDAFATLTLENFPCMMTEKGA